MIIIPFGLTALAWVGGVGLGVLGLAAGSRPAAPTDPTATAAAPLGARAPALLLGSRCCSGSTSRSRSVSRARTRAGHDAAAACNGCSPASRVGHRAVRDPRSRPPASGTPCAGWCSIPCSTCAAGAACRSRRRGRTSTASCRRAGALCNSCSWPLPDRGPASQQLSLWFFLLLGVVIFSVVAGWRAVRARPDVDPGAHAPRRRALQPRDRAAGDATRRLRPLRVGELRSVRLPPGRAVRFRAPRAPRVSTRRLALGARRAVLALVVFVLPAFTATRYADYSLQTFGVHRHSYEIEHDGRVFYYGKQDRAEAATGSDRRGGAHLASPGSGSSSGPANLRKTPYSDAYLYYMLAATSCPRPTTSRWIRAWPTPTTPGSTDELASADIVILSTIWDNWAEPNDSRNVGSDKSEQVLARDFCLVGTALPKGLYQLYREVPVPTGAAPSFRPDACARRDSDLPGIGEHRRVPAPRGAAASRRRHPRRRRQQPRRHRRPRRRGGRGARAHRSAAPARKIGIGDAVRAGFDLALDRGYDIVVQIDADLSHDPAALPDAARGDRTRRRWRDRLAATFPADPSRTGRGTAGPCRSGATATPCSCSACRSATRRPGTARFGPTTLKAADYAQARSKGYGFQIELCYRIWQHGGRIAQVPIAFTDRVRGHSKMSLSVAPRSSGSSRGGVSATACSNAASRADHQSERQPSSISRVDSA